MGYRWRQGLRRSPSSRGPVAAAQVIAPARTSAGLSLSSGGRNGAPALDRPPEATPRARCSAGGRARADVMDLESESDCRGCSLGSPGSGLEADQRDTGDLIGRPPSVATCRRDRPSLADFWPGLASPASDGPATGICEEHPRK